MYSCRKHIPCMGWAEGRGSPELGRAQPMQGTLLHEYMLISIYIIIYFHILPYIVLYYLRLSYIIIYITVYYHILSHIISYCILCYSILKDTWVLFVQEMILAGPFRLCADLLRGLLQAYSFQLLSCRAANSVERPPIQDNNENGKPPHIGGAEWSYWEKTTNVEDLKEK